VQPATKKKTFIVEFQNSRTPLVFLNSAEREETVARKRNYTDEELRAHLEVMRANGEDISIRALRRRVPDAGDTARLNRIVREFNQGLAMREALRIPELPQLFADAVNAFTISLREGLGVERAEITDRSRAYETELKARFKAASDEAGRRFAEACEERDCLLRQVQQLAEQLEQAKGELTSANDAITKLVHRVDEERATWQRERTTLLQTVACAQENERAEREARAAANMKLRALRERVDGGR
jgi:hypothetical protein